MDKNQTIGFVLLMGLLMGWYLFTAPTQEELEAEKIRLDSIENAQIIAKESLDDDVKQMNFQNQGGTDSLSNSASAVQASIENFELANELMTIQFSNKGGAPQDINLKEFKQVIVGEDKSEEKVPLVFNKHRKNRFEYIFQLKDGTKLSTQNLVFDANQNNDGIEFTTSLPGGAKVQQIYSLKPNSYVLDYELKIDGVSQSLDPTEEEFQFRWNRHLEKLEVNEMFEKTFSTIYFKPSDDSSDYCSCRANDDETTSDAIKWISHTNQFFNTTINPTTFAYQGGEFETIMGEDDDDFLKITKAQVNIPLSSSSNINHNFQLFLGPNDYYTLQGFDEDLVEIIAFGRSIFGSINRHFIRPFFNFLSQFIGSKGLVIITLIFIIKMALYPLMYKMLKSQAKMGVLKPEIQKITDKFKDDPQAKQMETMKVYQQYGVSPLGGCMPMILQMPIWYALFRFFPASLTFRQEPFLWANDLSSYDIITYLPFEIPMFGSHLSLFTVLWAITTIIYAYYNTKHMDMSANPAMKYIQYFMPIMFLVFFNNYASGLTCYMFFSNLFNIGQTVLTKKFVFNDEKLLAELEEKKKNKPKKKKGGFMQRLEEIQKKQLEVRKQQAEQSKKSKK